MKKALLESSAEQIAELRVELEEANQCAVFLLSAGNLDGCPPACPRM